jgi:hypothetical protein
MSKHDITELIKALGNIPAILAKAAPHDKAQLYSQLGLHLTYEPAKRLGCGSPEVTRLACSPSQARSA